MRPAPIVTFSASSSLAIVTHDPLACVVVVLLVSLAAARVCAMGGEG